VSDRGAKDFRRVRVCALDAGAYPTEGRRAEHCCCDRCFKGHQTAARALRSVLIAMVVDFLSLKPVQVRSLAISRAIAHREVLRDLPALTIR
jgi:hypothetical protein